MFYTCVNTVDDWRDMKVGIFSKRQRGESTSPGEWDSRVLPQPLARIVFAAIEESVSFGSRWKAWRERLGLADNSSITMLSDGAKWLWEEQRKHLTLADGVLDIFHVLEHITATRQALCSDPGLTIRDQARPGTTRHDQANTVRSEWLNSGCVITAYDGGCARISLPPDRRQQTS